MCFKKCMHAFCFDFSFSCQMLFIRQTFSVDTFQNENLLVEPVELLKMDDTENPLTVLKCPCGRYMTTTTGLEDHLKSCCVLIDLVNSGEGDDDTPVIREPNSTKRETVVGKVNGVEIIEFRSPKVLVDKSVLIETPEIRSTTTGTRQSLASARKPVEAFKKLPKATRILTRKRPRKNDGPCSDDEYSDFNTLEESESDDTDYAEPTSKKRKIVYRALADERFKFKCSVCPYTKFSQESEYKWHMTHVHEDSSKKNQSLSCPLCGRMFNFRKAFQSHLKRHVNAEALEDAFNLWEYWPPTTNKRAFYASCKYCILPHKTHHSFLTHMKTQHPGKGRFQTVHCPYCENHKFDTFKLFLVHMRTSHQLEYFGKTGRLEIPAEGKAPCPVCQKSFIYLGDHLETMHLVRSDLPVPDDNSEEFQCPLCFTTTKGRDRLRRHFLLHLDSNPYTCRVKGCSYKAGNEYHFRRHLRVHTGDDLFQCEKCNVSFARKNRLDEHKCNFDRKKIRKDANGFWRSIYGNTKYPGMTPKEKILTEKTCRTKRTLGEFRIKTLEIIKSDPVYLKVVKENPEFEKTLFGTFKRDVSALHKAFFRCQSCSTQLYDKKGLEAHKKICTGDGENDTEGKVGCPICGKSFESFNDLLRHVEKVHPSKVFKCDKCERMFSGSATLSKHLQRHETLYGCTGCDRRFKTKSEQTNHKLICKAPKRRECSKCGRVLVNIASWKRHLKTQHGITMETDDNRKKTHTKKKANGKKTRTKTVSLRKTNKKPPTKKTAKKAVEKVVDLVEEDSEVIVKKEMEEVGGDIQSGFEEPVDILIKTE